MSLSIVAGMHRSGTSLATALLAAIGLDLGNEGTFIATDAANPKGFHEQLPVVEVNERILERLGGSWRSPPDLGPTWWTQDALRDLRPVAVEAVETAFAGHSPGPRALKDPRFSLTLPFWREVVDVTHVIHVVRDPSEVVASLTARDGLSADQGVLLWLQYVSHLSATAPHALVLTHQGLLTDPHRLMSAAAASLGLPEPEASARTRVDELVDPSLWRHQKTEPATPLVALAQQVAAGLSDPDPIRDLVVAASNASAERHVEQLALWQQAMAERDELRIRAQWGQDQDALLSQERREMLNSTAWKIGSAITSLRDRLPSRRG